MRITAAGASGFVGTHLVRALRHAGHEVTVLVRRAPRHHAEAAWSPAERVLPTRALAGADAVVNLCGAPVAGPRWTAGRRRILRASRLTPTRLLAEACARHNVPVLVNASAVGYYGDRGDARVTESDGPGTGFLAKLCTDWEAATAPAASAGVRVVNLRTGLVLGPNGGMLPLVARLTRLGLGGRLGSGEQYWPWISITDHIEAIRFLLDHPVTGPVNLTAPTPVTNAEFTDELGRTLRRPTPWVVPAPALRTVLGGFAHEVLTGQRAMPDVLTAHGFEYLHPELSTALRAWALP